MNRDITFLINQDPAGFDSEQRQSLIKAVNHLYSITQELMIRIKNLQKEFVFLKGPFHLNNYVMFLLYNIPV